MIEQSIRGILLAAFLLWSGAAGAADPLRLDALRLDAPLPANLFGRLEFVEDAQQALTLAQVRQLPADRFTALTNDNFKRRFSASAFWLRLTVRNDGAEDQEWVIKHLLPFTDLLQFWVLDGDRVLAHAIGGDRTLMAQRAVPSRFPALRYRSRPGQAVQLVIRLSNEQSSHVHLMFDISRERDFQQDQAFDQLRLGALYGMPLTLGCMALAGWLLARDRRSWLYAAYAFSVLGSWLGMNGQLAQYLFVGRTDLANIGFHIFFLLAIAFSAIFSRAFLGTARAMPWSDRYLRLLIWVALAGVVLRLCGVYTLVTQIVVGLLVLDAGTPVVGWLAYRRGVRFARWYVLAQLFYSAMIGILIALTLLRVRTFSYDAFVLVEYAFFGQLLLLTVAQYDRLQVLRRNSLESRKRYQHELETAVDERTAELRAARERADQASQSKSDFLVNISHEIRTPINAIAGFTTLAERTSLNPKQSGYLEQIGVATQALLRVVNDLLDFSRIEAGQLDLQRQPFRLDDVIAAMRDYIGPLAERKGLAFDVEVDPGVPPVLLGDGARLGQVLVNLCGNAVKFTDHGEVALRVRPVALDAAGVRLQFAVRDTGVGLSPAQSQQLFAPFTQVDPSRTRKFGGIGLGLAICRRLVDMMDGLIWLDSQAGHGATFFVELRFAAAAAQTASIAAGAVAAGRAPAPALDTLLARFGDAMATVHASLAALAPAPSLSPDQAEGPDAALRERLQPLLAELVDCLRGNDTRAEALVAGLRAQAGAAAASLEPVERAIHALEYDAALALLDAGGWTRAQAAP